MKSRGQCVLEQPDPPLSYGDLPMTPNRDLEGQLHGFYQGPAQDHRFQTVLVRLECFHEIEPLQFYDRPDKRDAHAWILKLIERFRAGEKPQPLVFAWEEYAPRLLDGYHRAAAAREVGIETVDAFELVGWKFRLPD